MKKKIIPRGISTGVSNKVTLAREGIIRIKIIGDQNGRTARRVLFETQRIFDTLCDSGRPKLVLVDFTKIGRETKESIKVAGHFTQLGYDRLALFGLKPRLERIGNTLITATGNMHRAKIFKTESEALDWLVSEVEPVPAKPHRLFRLLTPLGVLLITLLAVAASSFR